MNFKLALLQALFARAASACLLDLAHVHEGSLSASSMMRKRAPAPRTTTAIQNVRVFDGKIMSPPQTVVIDGETIRAVFSGAVDTSHLPNITVATTVDGSGQFLIPGLIDSHVHITNVAGLENITSFGVTTAMVMACHNYTQCAAIEGLDGLCDVHTAGIPATGPGSHHASMFGLSPDMLIYPTSNATEVVAYAFGNHSDFYKITAETNGPSLDMQTALVAAVHGLGQFSMTHAADVEAWAEAVASGTDGIQHLATNGLINASVVAAMKAQPNQYSTPTLNIARYGLSDPALQAILGKSSGDNSYANVRANAVAVRTAGIPVLAGTDAVGVFSTGPNSTVAIPFGLTLHYELQNLVEVGLTPAEALRAATSTAAQWHGLAGSRGSVAPSLRADLVLLKSNPLVDIANTLDLARVWVGGVEYADVADGRKAAADSPNPTPPDATNGTTDGTTPTGTAPAGSSPSADAASSVTGPVSGMSLLLSALLCAARVLL
ncbi:Metal-dependent hydrolase, composite domain protein [Niveomyces insectorum RCEF 264]|uniref:Metal-dependent hydrolase, composite domain protein n=1 Tax=Niveomyces insectorum RCEF 264 TaxID=1081102 RepID=A0A162MEX7_9HYPO|nr:Metal-dependent hydrolase, composite domain protein [Niveomyces insectorum RCEF 264]